MTIINALPVKNNGWIGNTAALLRLLMNYARCCRSQKRSDTIEHRIIMYRMFSSSLLFSKYWISNLASASHSSPPPILDPQSLAEEECNHRNSCTTSPLPGASSVLTRLRGFPGSCLGRGNRSKLSPHLIQLLPTAHHHACKADTRILMLFSF